MDQAVGKGLEGEMIGNLLRIVTQSGEQLPKQDGVLCFTGHSVHFFLKHARRDLDIPESIQRFRLEQRFTGSALQLVGDIQRFEWGLRLRVLLRPTAVRIIDPLDGGLRRDSCLNGQ